jgi:hypothetical protein
MLPGLRFGLGSGEIWRLIMLAVWQHAIWHKLANE